MTTPEFVFADRPETEILKSASHSAKLTNKVLLGTYLKVSSKSGSFYKVKTRKAGPGGYVRISETSTEIPLKVFFVDVGQGDGTLIECPQGVVVVDGGVGDSFYRFLRYRYQPIIDQGTKIHIVAMFISHPDGDHYKGLQPLLEDEDFSVGTIYHNGLMRYDKKIEGSRTKMIQQGYLEAGTLSGKDAWFVTDIVDELGDLTSRYSEMPSWFRGFWKAAEKAADEGRLGGAKRLEAGEEPAGFTTKAGGKLEIKVLGPALNTLDDSDAFLAFGEPEHREADQPHYPEHGYSHSHTRNGHSLVLKLQFGKHRILLGGDLNIPSQQHLLDHYGRKNPFRCEVAKACHHGSSDFSPEFLKKVKPYATTISSGDNKSFDHPTADAVGAVARHSRGTLPLVYSTELARAYEVDASGEVSIHYGLANLRSNGTTLTMAQMKEQRMSGGKPKKDIWDSHVVPYDGKFWYERS